MNPATSTTVSASQRRGLGATICLLVTLVVGWSVISLTNGDDGGVTVPDNEWLAERFDAHRAHLRAVAYRMLGSLAEADDAVQEAWLKLSRSDHAAVANLGGWLTAVVGRVCLDMLRSRRARREEPLEVRLPEPILSRTDAPDPEQEVLLADSVGLALQVVLETLDPAERLAFVLHDLFGVPFPEIAPILGRSAGACRQLASRARRRIRTADATPDPDLARQREVVEAFLAASRRGDFDALLAVLDPDVVVRADWGPGLSRVVRGGAAVARQAHLYASRGVARPALVNGAAGLVVTRRGQLFAVLGFTVVGGRIVEIDILADPERLRLVTVAPEYEAI
jgi:RNA polymerase sigma factor (sigma-70 family)